MKYYIYTLSDPITNFVRYVGKTNNPKQRLASHICLSSNHNTHKYNWIKSLKTNKLKPIMDIIDTFDNEIECNIFEIYWISQFKSWGFKLCNHSHGGEGNYGMIVSEDTKIRISTTLKELYKTKDHPNKGKALSYNHIQKLKTVVRKSKKPYKIDKPSKRRKIVLVFKDGIFIEKINGLSQVCEKYNLLISNAQKVCTGKQYKTRGYHLEYEKFDYESLKVYKYQIFDKLGKSIYKSETLTRISEKFNFNQNSLRNAFHKGKTYKGYLILPI